MRKNLFIFNFKLMPRSLVLCVILFIGVEYCVRPLAPYFVSYSDRLIIFKRDFIKENAPLSYDALILGDSRAFGIDAQFLSDQVIRKNNKDFQMYNFSFAYQYMRSYYLFLKKYLDYNVCPEYVLFVSMPRAFAVKEDFAFEDKKALLNLHRFSLIFNISDAYQVMPFRILPKILTMEIERMSYLITYRRSIELMLRGYIARKLPKPYDINTITYNRSGGSDVGWSSPPTEVEVDTAYTEEFVVNQEDVMWFKKFLRLAQENDIKVLLINAPIPEAGFKIREQNGMRQKYMKMIGDIAQEYSNLSILSQASGAYSNNYFLDTHHLNNRGAAKFTEDLGRVLTGWFNE